MCLSFISLYCFQFLACQRIIWLNTTIKYAKMDIKEKRRLRQIVAHVFQSFYIFLMLLVVHLSIYSNVNNTEMDVRQHFLYLYAIDLFILGERFKIAYARLLLSKQLLQVVIIPKQLLYLNGSYSTNYNHFDAHHYI